MEQKKAIKKKPPQMSESEAARKRMIQRMKKNGNKKDKQA